MKVTRDNSNAKSGLQAPPVPQVNLLPDEIATAKEAGKIKKWLGLAILLAIVVVGGGYYLGSQAEADAEDALDVAQADTLTLTRARNQLQYVPRVYDFLERAEVALQVAMYPEIIWQDYFDAVTAVLPDDASITTLHASLSPTNLLTGDDDTTLEGPYGAVLSFETRSATIPDTAAWLTGLNSINGLSDASLQSTAHTETDGSVYYQTQVRVHATADALSLRFMDNEEAESDEEADSDASTEEDGE